MISNCGNDSRGKYSGDKAGDNNGREWRLIPWWNFKPDVVLLHPDKAVNDLVAEMSIAAAANDHIGYDQSERTTFYNQLKAVGWKPEKIKVDCEADCSSGVAAIVQGAGHRLGNGKLKTVSQHCWTGNLRKALVSAGYEEYTASRYLSSDVYLPKGAIILNEKSHVAIQATEGSKVTSAPAPAAPSVGFGAGTYVLTGDGMRVRADGNIYARVKTIKELTIDGQRHAYPNGTLKEGTRVTVMEVKASGGYTWGRIPSGWVCLKEGNRVYAQRA